MLRWWRTRTARRKMRWAVRHKNDFLTLALVAQRRWDRAAQGRLIRSMVDAARATQHLAGSIPDPVETLKERYGIT